MPPYADDDPSDEEINGEGTFCAFVHPEDSERVKKEAETRLSQTGPVRPDIRIHEFQVDGIKIAGISIDNSMAFDVNDIHQVMKNVEFTGIEVRRGSLQTEEGARKYLKQNVSTIQKLYANRPYAIACNMLRTGLQHLGGAKLWIFASLGKIGHNDEAVSHYELYLTKNHSFTIENISNQRVKNDIVDALLKCGFKAGIDFTVQTPKLPQGVLQSNISSTITINQDTLLYQRHLIEKFVEYTQGLAKTPLMENSRNR